MEKILLIAACGLLVMAVFAFYRYFKGRRSLGRRRH